ncbi:PepSY-associated TM helix domain-containing protein [Candidatus Nitrotoga sp. 1052]|uniref:PepSY-associated TM helix domain-containing protein n=1 Tax=Candidatus Nitrotoga sp. 1052 TaxID=2886964 RepID=UPI001EF6518D|nr:PepSY-associated TM helix domain-containing protein [Candidatus Nitrotoga sp. 1052]CAH1082272.1 putative transmembrane protein [Candidatus Nitrotoga sp. 1052]
MTTIVQLNKSHNASPVNGVNSDLIDSKDRDIRLRHAVFLKWLRKTHGWIGLWGAAIGLLFGMTGILLNHRTVLKIPAAQVQETMLQIPLPTPAPANVKEMASWLQRELMVDRPASRERSEPAKPVAWGDKTLKQPAHWSVTFSSPQANLQAEYWAGNNFVSVKRSDQNVFGTLTNLHKGNGVAIPWILLADTLAGSIILLSLTGVVLWTQLNRRRMIGFGIGLTSLTLLIGFAMRELV